ncbi:N2227-domain-containing protein [Tothia fuscella]|uniref:carnosine N-methyltransferase n=1 Tax=Tothia fuscella TaxID=1048955 RepID=A0A9P4NY99_9PEZI|nr:N2227-domain-containing protein [Tothia fuscella]
MTSIDDSSDLRPASASHHNSVCSVTGYKSKVLISKSYEHLKCLGISLPNFSSPKRHPLKTLRNPTLPTTILTIYNSTMTKEYQHRNPGIQWDEVSCALAAFTSYHDMTTKHFLEPRNALLDILKKEDPKAAELMRPFWDQKETSLKKALLSNDQLAQAIVSFSQTFFLSYNLDTDYKTYPIPSSAPSPTDHAVVRSTIRQFWRDWSCEGKTERSACHAPVREDLESHYQDNREQVRILIPGAGLTRLGYDLAVAGFSVDAIDVSYIQLLATNFVLSQKDGKQETSRPDPNLTGEVENGDPDGFTLYPFATQFSSHLQLSDQFAHVKVPDLGPASFLGPPHLDLEADTLTFSAKGLSLSAKDFTKDLNTAQTAGTYDTVATVFFIDTAKNFFDYARTVHHVLKDGGLWINVGPLLWNCYELGPGGRREGDVDTDEDNRSRVESATGGKKGGLDSDVGGDWDPKIELSNEEVLALLVGMGFEVTKQEILKEEAGYIQDPESMLQAKYRLAHWVARKLPKED